MKTVKEISELTGISIRALRYYDEIRLLIPTERSEAGYRLYDDKALEKLRAILFLKELDIPLDTIKHVVNTENSDYAAVLKDYRKTLVQKIGRLQGLLRVVDDMDLETAEISFEAFNIRDAESVAETLVNSAEISKFDREEAISEMQELVRHNMVDGKVGVELLQIYGSKENYLSAVEESALHPEVNTALQEELKDIYFAFRDSAGELMKTQELVKRLEDNTKKMYRTANARYILLKVAEDYLAKGNTVQVLDNVYGKGVTDTIGKAIYAYYGV
ncbi:MAG: MerR family transcriptional regulator [Lachnospiraceae bacterium]|nr:MerR family transcriptional regulator [Lachnospiraceae bacterium]